MYSGKLVILPLIHGNVVLTLFVVVELFSIISVKFSQLVKNSGFVIDEWSLSTNAFV